MPENNNTRSAAACVLSRCDAGADNVGQYLNASDCPSRAALTDYVYGVLRNRTLLDAIAEKIASVKESRVEKPVMNAIRIAVYEMIYKPQTPMYAIINEAAAQFHSRHKKGFVNAVLRNIQRAILERGQCCGDFAADFVPAGGFSGCKFGQPVLPEPSKDAVAYLSKAFSMPENLLRSWGNCYGKDALKQICLASNRVPTIYLRPNTTKTTAAELYEKLIAGGVDCEICGDGMIAAVSLGKAENISSLAGYEEGFFCVQDITAAKAALFMAPQAGQTIVDLCAAPGTKTTHLAELAGRGGRVIATDVNAARLRLVEQNAKRLGLDNIYIVSYGDIYDYLRGLEQIDAVLIDAPCSNSGVLAKRVEARYRISEKSISELAQMQLQILADFANNIKSCKQVFYSTCSIDSRENTQVLHTFLQKYPNYSKTAESLTLPDYVNHGCDGGYIAKLVNNGVF